MTLLLQQEVQEWHLVHSKDILTFPTYWRYIDKHVIVCLQQVVEVQGRYLVHSGDMVEVDCESLTTLHKVHIFLLNDSLIVATWLPHRSVNVPCALIPANLAIIRSVLMIDVHTRCKINGHTTESCW